LIEKGVERFWNVEEEEGLNVGLGGHERAPELDEDLGQIDDDASQRSEEPVSRIMSYAIGGVPIASEP
jgi:hypothetical protein